MADPAPTPIHWDNTDWNDVNAYVAGTQAGNPNWSKFWNDFLWFGEPPDKLARDVGAGIHDAATGLQDATTAAASAAGQAAGEAAASTWKTLAPYLAIGALVFVGIEVIKAR